MNILLLDFHIPKYKNMLSIMTFAIFHENVHIINKIADIETLLRELPHRDFIS